MFVGNILDILCVLNFKYRMILWCSNTYRCHYFLTQLCAKVVCKLLIYFRGIIFRGFKLSRFREFFVAFAIVYTREIVLLRSLAKYGLKIQKNCQNSHENQIFEAKFPSIAKVYTCES